MAKNKEPKSIYFVGIKGVAMAGLAVMAQQLGLEVNGSDTAEIFPTDEMLHRHKISFHQGFAADHLKYKPDLVVISAAYGLTNPEVKAAKSLRLTVLNQSELLGKYMERFEGIGVAGVHGKTTTSSMLAYILQQAGFSPSYSIGTGSIVGLEDSAHIGDGQYFVAEADEYRKSDLTVAPKFLDLPLQHVIITSIELDHPDIYATAEQVYNVFYQLTTKIPRGGTIVACTDWPLVKRLVTRRADRPCTTYGFEATAQYQIVNFEEHDAVTFEIKHNEEVTAKLRLSVPGKHNALNATAAGLMASKLGISWEIITKALASFVGAKRRFEYLGDYNGAKFYDDYAHHPTALTYLLESAHRRFAGKHLVVVFQPHTYSRTGKMLKEFAYSLKTADKLILLNIWASAREKSGYVTIKDLIDEVKKYNPGVEYRPTLDELATYLKSFVTEKDVVLLIGAGDVYKIFEKIVG